jgi:cell wall-associated NlpC family hydrolase
MMTPPSCPKFPATWTPDIRKAARMHAELSYPKEAAGFVKGDAYVALLNRSSTPHDDVVLDDADQLRVAEADLFFHSHPDGLGCPSESDMRYQLQLGIPFVITVWPQGDEFCFGDQLDRAPLVGRAFRHGVHDCYSLIRDWFHLQGVDLPTGPRGWEWWLKGQQLYIDNFPGAGFEQIALGDATRPGDLVLSAFQNKTPMHGALIYDDHLLLHHIAGVRPVDITRLSAVVPRVRWVRFATMALRLRDFTPKPLKLI